MSILIICGTIFARNRGVAAITRGCIDCIRKASLKSRIALVHNFVESYYPRKTTCVGDIKVLIDGGKPLIRLFIKMFIHVFVAMVWRVLSSFNINMKTILYDELLKQYEKADVVINLSYGDMLAFKKDFYGRLLFVVISYYCMLAILLKKTLIFFPQSIGPFYGRIPKFLAKFILNQSHVVLVRERISKDYLINDLKIKTMVCFLPDLSFVVKSVSNQRVREIFIREKVKVRRPLIGVALRDNLYTHLDEISKVINYLILKMNASIIFIPHFSSKDTPHFYYDPRFITEKLLEKIDEKRWINMIKGDYTVEELRGLIGKCDLFIGAYMHANISALSMYVPTVALSYSHKTEGIMDLVGLSDFVLNINELNATNLIRKIEKLYDGLHEYREFLKRRIPMIQKRVLKVADFIPKL